jgi:mucin-2
MQAAQRTENTRLARAGLVTLLAGMVLLTGWMLFPGRAAAVFPPVAGNCDGTTGTGIPGGSGSGGPVVVNGVTFTWSGQSVTISGGSATFCVKAANFNSGVITRGPGTHVIVEWDNDGTALGPGDQPPAISHIQVYSTTTTTTTTGTTTTGTTTTGTTTTGTTTTGTTTTGTTTTGTTTTGTTTSRAPTTVTPTDGTTSPGGTTTSGGTAFTGIANVIPLGVLALSLMTAGSGLLWAGTRRSRRGEEE